MTDRTLPTAAETLVLDPPERRLSRFDRVEAILERWHNVEHAGAYRFCDAEPCDVVRRFLVDERDLLDLRGIEDSGGRRGDE